MRSAMRAITAVLLCLPLLAGADDKPKRVKYVPPEGFAGHRWGELHSTFTRLSPEPLGVAAAYIQPKEKRSYTYCRPNPVPPEKRGMNGPYESCHWQQTLDTVRKEFQGGGYYVLSEYLVPDQAFRWGAEDDGVLIHPVVYQFCANWRQSRKKLEPPPNFDTINKLCGMRMLFQSESREELAKLPHDHVTVYDQMLEKLRAKYGPPAHFMKRGQVIIETDEGEHGSNSRTYSIWRWCPAAYGGFHPDCKASVTLSIDTRSGVGTVLYSTPLLWEYAYARENNGFPNDRLFAMLHARK